MVISKCMVGINACDASMIIQYEIDKYTHLPKVTGKVSLLPTSQAIADFEHGHSSILTNVFETLE